MLHTLRPAKGSKRSIKRIARGNSGKGGTTAGRGTKGQHARTGKGRRAGFEGGQVPLLRRQPKLGGFTNHRRTEYEALTLKDLETRLPAGTYAIADLRERKIVSPRKLVKIIGSDKISKSWKIEAHAVSKGAKELIAKAGGEVSIVKSEA